MSSWLKEMGIVYEEQKKFNWLRNIRQLSLDFYLPEYNIAIECQGEHHFTNEFFGDVRKDYVKTTSTRDALKYNQCKEHGVDIIYFVDLKTECPKEYFSTIIKSKEELVNILQSIKKVLHGKTPPLHT